MQAWNVKLVLYLKSLLLQKCTGKIDQTLKINLYIFIVSIVKLNLFGSM